MQGIVAETLVRKEFGRGNSIVYLGLLRANGHGKPKIQYRLVYVLKGGSGKSVTYHRLYWQILTLSLPHNRQPLYFS